MATTTPVGQYSILDNNNLIGIFDRLYEQEVAGDWAPMVGNLLTSDKASETYGWLGAAPSLEELKGDMTEEQFAQYSYTLRNVEYAKAIKILERDMRRDKVGQIEMRLGDLSRKAQDHWKLLASNLMINGATSGFNSYDGVTFYNAAHLESGTAQKNLLTNSDVGALDVATATAPTATEAQAIVTGLIGKFYEMTDNKGDPINGEARSFVVVVGTADLWAPFNEAIYGRLASGSENRVQALSGQAGITITLVLNPRLKALTTNVFMFRTDSPVKAFVFQEEVPLEPLVSNKQNDEYIKYRRFIFALYTSRAAGYLRWQSALKATLS